MRKITITPVLNGWVIKVGCSEVVSTDKNAMLRELGRYIDDPDKIEKEYVGNAVNKQVAALANVDCQPTATASICSSEDAACDPESAS